MKKDFNKVYDFVCVDREMVAKGGSYSFRSYPDKMGAFGTPGADVFFDDGSVDRRGKNCGKGFSLNQSHYNLQAREGQTDYQKRELKDFFLNAPFCEGSPNGNYSTPDGSPITHKELLDRETLLTRIKMGEITQHGVKIRLKEDARDAKIKLDVGKRRAEAQVSAGNLDVDTLKEVASLITPAYFGVADELMRDAVFEFAGKRPVDYFQILESGDRPFRAMIKAGVRDGVLKEKGNAVYYGNEVLGANEDAAVARLQTDKVMLDSLQEDTNLKIQVKVIKPKKAN